MAAGSSVAEEGKSKVGYARRSALIISLCWKRDYMLDSFQEERNT